MVQTTWVPKGLFLFLIWTFVSGQPQDDFSDLLPGPYCSQNNCCPGREDDCAIPILGTHCYCDRFCENSRVNDCCPDYWQVCLNINPSTVAPARLEQYSCEFEGRNYGLGSIVKKNCNACKCNRIEGKVEMLCETDECLVDQQLIESINSQRQIYDWSATNYSEFWGRKLKEGIELRLGTFKPKPAVMRMTPERLADKYNPQDLPRQFDSETKWPGMLNPIQDQGWCGSSWAVSTAAVASDRFAIQSNGTEKVQLSAEHLLSCIPRGQQACKGGHLDKAWRYVHKYGLVAEQCFPYTAQIEHCSLDFAKGQKMPSECNPIFDRTLKYHVGPPKKSESEQDIMYNIHMSGPVQALMKVYHDFFSYEQGIYRHSEESRSQSIGYHSVRIVGWGEEYTYSGTRKYWKVANSWGPQWGENGYFRILRGSNECEIESFVLTVLAKLKKT